MCFPRNFIIRLLCLVPFCDARLVRTCLNSPLIHNDLLDRRKWGIRWIFRPVWPASSLQRCISMCILVNMGVCGCALELLSLAVWRTQFFYSMMWISFLQAPHIWWTLSRRYKYTRRLHSKLRKIIFPAISGQFARSSIVIRKVSRERIYIFRRNIPVTWK